ncbi:TRAP transporter small permease subunit [Litorisediminicola beolgyonensis]|uniref:TRAP transporter small permease protein n=1 Tax=Litorisediminicola beolgyonensis TaxID=1173614 RepID=A0ABW3ZKF1_9RHOB
MPDFSFTLPHWLYWVGLIVFPLIAMSLARRPKVYDKGYSVPLGYMILVTGGMLGLHRFYLKNLWGFIFIPVFLVILVANGQSQDARSAVSDLANERRIAEGTLEREASRVETARADVEGYRQEVAEAEEGSFAQKSAQRRLDRTERAITDGESRLAEARQTLSTTETPFAEAQERRANWTSTARWAFYVLCALMLIDAILMKRLVTDANRNLRPEERSEAEAALEAAGVTDQKPDRAYAENWIDRLSLFCGEFTAYWAVIAVFVYYFEVISRYVFNSPTNWAHEAMYLMFGMQYLIAGSYAMLTEQHVRVDIFYAPMTREKKAWVDILTSIFFFIFAGTLLVTSWIFAMDAIAVPSGNGLISQWARGEVATTDMLAGWSLNEWTDPNIRWGEISFNEWEVPLWPMKWVMVVGAVLLVLQGISKLGKDIRALGEG